MEEHKASKSIFEVMNPQQTFLFGLVGGVMLLCTIGFFILLAIFLKGGASMAYNNGNNNDATNNGGAANVVANNNDAPTTINIRAIDTKNDHIRGNANAKVTIVEYSDPECPFCKQFHQTMKQLVDKYGDDIRWVYRNFPLDGLHSQARTESLAMECAAAQGKFWEYTDLLYQTTNSNNTLDLTLLPKFASQVGLNLSKFNTCYNNKDFADKVQADIQDAQAAGGQGTPYSVLIGPDGTKTAINGAYPYAQVEQMVQQYLN